MAPSKKWGFFAGLEHQKAYLQPCYRKWAKNFTKQVSISHSPQQWCRRPALSEVTAKAGSGKEAEESCLSPRAPHPHPSPAPVIHAADCVLIHLNSLAQNPAETGSTNHGLSGRKIILPVQRTVESQFQPQKLLRLLETATFIEAYHRLIRNICSCISLRTLHVILYPFQSTTTPIAGFGAHTEQTLSSQPS